MITNFIQLDFNKENDLKVPSVQYDSGSRFVKIKLQRNKSPFKIDGYRVTVVANKVDGTEIMNDCTILDGVNGVVQFEITEQFNAVEGVVDCQLKLFKGKTLLTSMPFSINVVKSVSTKEIVSSNELKTLVNALGEVQNIDNRFAQTNAQLSDITLNVKKPPLGLLGAVGDGQTDDTKAINNLIEFAKNNGYSSIYFPKSEYKINQKEGICFKSLENFNIYSNGGKIIAGGVVDRTFNLINCDNVEVFGFYLIGSTERWDGVANNEQLHGITITENCKNIKIHNCYITNFLGDQIYIGATLENGATLGVESQNIDIFNNTIKERYGNGVKSFSGGHSSRLSVAVICGVNVSVYNNKIFGSIDLEPNVDGQILENIFIKNNEFISCVIPQQKIDNYNFDEEISNSQDERALKVKRQLLITGRPGNPIIKNVCFENNRFDLGEISTGAVYKADVIGNVFNDGEISLGSTSGSKTSENIHCVGNKTLTCENGFIKLHGYVSHATICDNHNKDANPVVSEGNEFIDLGRNIILGNSTKNETAINLSGLKSTTVIGNNVSSTSSKIEFSNLVTQKMEVSKTKKTIHNIELSTNETIIDYNNLTSDLVTLRNSFSVKQFTNVPDGVEITLMLLSRDIRLIHSTQTIRLKDGADCISPDANAIVTLICRSGIMFEKTRNF